MKNVQSQDDHDHDHLPHSPTSLLLHAFSGVDNKTIDIGRVIWFAGSLAFIFISAFYTWKTGAWNPLEWGLGFAALSGGSGAAIKLKEKTEPIK